MLGILRNEYVILVTHTCHTYLSHIIVPINRIASSDAFLPYIHVFFSLRRRGFQNRPSGKKV